MAETLDNEEIAGLKTAKNRLRDLQVPDVDIVDRPANKRRFLIVKKEDGMPEETTGNEFSTGGDIDYDLADPESGTPPAAAPATPAAGDTGTEPTTDNAGTAPDSATDDATPEAIAKAERESVKKAAEAHAALLAEKIAAIQKIADEIRTGAGTMDAKDLKSKISQLERLGWKIDDPANVINVLKSEGAEGEAAAVAKAIPTPVRDAVVKTLREASERLMSVNVALRGATVTQETMSTPLPDAVAREIKAIQTLVKSVVQRYPYPSPTGTAKGEAAEPEAATDLQDIGFETAHEMMKQAAAITLPAAVRDAVSAKVRGATELLLSIVDAVKKMETTEERLTAPLPAETATAVNKTIGILDEILTKYPSPAAKSDDAIAQLGRHFKAIESIVSSLAGGAVVTKDEPASSPAPVEDSRVGELMKRVEENTELIKKMAGVPATSNALADEGRTPVVKDEGEKVDWGMDLAEGK